MELSDKLSLICDNIGVIFEVLIPYRPKSRNFRMLRKELQVLQRSGKRPRLNLWDRLFFVSLFRLDHAVVDNIVTIMPSTVLAWHRKLAARRIVGELRKLGKIISKSTVLNILKESDFRDWIRRQDQSWYRFLRNREMEPFRA